MRWPWEVCYSALIFSVMLDIGFDRIKSCLCAFPKNNSTYRRPGNGGYGVMRYDQICCFNKVHNPSNANYRPFLNAYVGLIVSGN